MLNIYLVRHGQNEDNVNGILNGHRDLPLTKIGLEQAKNLALHVEHLGLSFDRVYASPLSRAFVTAEILTDHLKIPKPDKLDLLIERNLGVMSGEKIADIPKLCGDKILKTQIITYFLEAEGSEDFPTLLARGKKAVDEIKKRHKDGNILLVCHGDIGKMIYAAFYNIDWKDALQNFHFGNSEVVLLSESCRLEDAHIFKQEQFNH
jgi:broad specificity phosphatase PhoE